MHNWSNSSITALEQIEAKAGADPGFLERGFISTKVWFYLTFFKYPMEMKPNYFIYIGYLKMGDGEGVQENHKKTL